MKKISSILLSLAMLMSMAVVPASAASDGLDITEIPDGIYFYGQGFEGSDIAVGDTLATSMGFSAVDQATGTSSLKTAKYVIAEDPVSGGTNGKVIRTKSNLALLHISDALKTQFDASTETVAIGSTSYKLLAYDFDGDGDTTDESYYLASRSTTELYWVSKASISDGKITNPTARTDYGYWFYINDDGSIKNVYVGNGAGGTSFTLPKPNTSEIIDQLAYQFDFTYPVNSAAYYGEEGFTFDIEGNQFYIRNNGIKSIDGTVNIQTGEGTYVSRTTSVHSWIPSGDEDDTPYFVATADAGKYLTTTTMAEGGVWHTAMVKVDMVDGYYTIYFDGKPVYFLINGTGYGCRIKLVNASVPSVRIGTNRLCTFADREPYFDNFKGYYSLYKVDGLDITEISGATKYFGQNFDEGDIAEGDRVTTAMGFASVGDTATLCNVRYTVAYDEITDVVETSNRVMQAKPNITMARATEEQYAALQASTTSVTFSDKEYKVIDFVDGYYIASQCTTRNTALYWFDKSYITDGALPASPTRDVQYGNWFSVDENNAISNIVKNPSGAGWTIPAPSEGVGSYAFQFDFAYPSNGNLTSGEEGFQINIEGNQYHIRTGGIVRSGTGTKTRELDFGESGTSVESENKNTMVPKLSLDIPHYFTADDYADNLTSLSQMYSDGEWNTVMVYFNLDDAYFTIYVNGLPVYAKASNGGYSCRYKFESTTPSAIEIRTDRYCVYNDHAPVFDNFLAYESYGTDEEIAERIINNIKIPYIDDFEVITGDIIFDADESELVEWSFSNDTFVIDEDNPLIARYNAPYGWGTSKVTLTATCTYNEAVETKDFELTVQDKPKYEIDTVLIKDSDGNRIYRPLDNSVIESVSYTANSDDTATMYLAVYESDGRLINAKKGTPSDGKITFNQAINADETYKVFIWEDGTLTPLALPETDDYIVSEKPTIFVLGDSIAATYSEVSVLRGWGQYLYKIFNDQVTVTNLALGGRTTKYALAEDKLKTVLDSAKPGDYLFIMYGHNDAKSTATTYHCASLEEYKFLLEQMITAAKAKGVETVILTSLARPQWDTNGVAKDSHGEYPETAMAAAEAAGAAVIDIDSLSRAVLTELGSAGIAELGYYNTNDSHTTSAGADWVVGMIADELATMNLPISAFLAE